MVRMAPQISQARGPDHMPSSALVVMRRRARVRRVVALVVLLSALLIVATPVAQGHPVRPRAGRSEPRSVLSVDDGGSGASQAAATDVVTAAAAGSGLGTVTSTDGRIRCGSACSSKYDEGTVLPASAPASPGARLVGWGGGDCSVSEACGVVVPRHTTVGAQVQALGPSAHITGVALDPQRHLVTFRFSGTVGATRFECGLAPRRTTPRLSRCRSPRTYQRRQPGAYVFTVQAAGSGRAAQTPTTRKVTLPVEFSNCWGASSRDPEHRCSNPALKHVVVPTPDDALLVPVGFCNRTSGVGGDSSICAFGATPATARGTIALIGDSHAGALRPAIAYVAAANHWAGLSYVHNGCGFSDALMADAAASSCYAWSQAVSNWLWQNQQITTVVITGADRRRFPSSAAVGFDQVWQAIPPWVTRIFIVRDVPHETVGESTCVQRALAKHLVPGTHCAQRESTVLTPDSEAAAALQSPAPRIHLINLTHFFCDGRRCFPVVGGALVESDTQHMTREFSLSLGPYVERAINRTK